MTKTFLKWAGNKQKLIPLIDKEFIGKKKRLVEPFVGSASFLLNSQYEEYLLCDTNEVLINLYQQLQNQGNSYIEYLKTFFNPINNTQEEYNKIRKHFNASKNINEKSAIFLYFNKHAFNGLCRFNSKGEFNVPFGFYESPTFPEEALNNFFIQTQQKKVIFKNQGFEQTLAEANANDCIYCDPPYIPLSATSSFTSYSTNSFGKLEQQKLAKMLLDCKKNGAQCIISNSDTIESRQLYQEATIIELSVQRSISAAGKSRGKAKEILAVF